MTIDPDSALLGLVFGALLGGGGVLLCLLLALAAAVVSRQKRALEAAAKETSALKREVAWPGDSQ